jgi:hypothetical protein
MFEGIVKPVFNFGFKAALDKRALAKLTTNKETHKQTG